MHDHGDRTAIGYASLNALRDKLAQAVGIAVISRDGGRGITFRVLEVALAGTLSHGANRSHAAIGLEGATLIEDQFTGTFISTGEERADHHGACARC